MPSLEGEMDQNEGLTGVIICGTINAVFRRMKCCVQSLKKKKLT